MLRIDNMHALPDKNGRRDLGDTTFDSASRRPASAALAAVLPIHGVCTRQMYHEFVVSCEIRDFVFIYRNAGAPSQNYRDRNAAKTFLLGLEHVFGTGREDI